MIFESTPHTVEPAAAAMPLREVPGLPNALREIIQWEEEFLLRDPTLIALERNQAGSGEPLKHADWQQFIAQRFAAASGFVPLLEAGARSAQRAHLPALAEAFASNLYEETGGAVFAADVSRNTFDRIVTQQRVRNEESHAGWRRHFIRALGLEESAIRPTPHTTMYAEGLVSTTTTNNPFEIAGALMALEASIPKEFAKIATGLAQHDPTQFSPPEKSSGSYQLAYADPRKYLYDHMVHDVRHAQEIEVAVRRSLQSLGVEEQSNALEALRRGTKTLFIFKNSFYDQFDFS